MAKMVIDFPINLEKINPKSGPSRRFSTGNGILKISEPLPIPNYLRASLGSCHDLCKYGAKRDVAPESISTKRGKMMNSKALGRKRLVPVPSSRQQPSESKSNQSSLKQLNKPLLKSTKNVKTCQDHAGKGTISVPLRSSSLPISSGKESIFRRSGKNASSPEKDTRLEIKKFVENVETCQNTSKGADRSSLEKDSRLENKKSVENSETCQNTSSAKETLFRRADKSSPEKDPNLEIKKSVENSETCYNTSSCKESLFRRVDETSPKKDSCLENKISIENSETCQKTVYEDIPEKIIHVVEPIEVKRDEDLTPNGSHCKGLVSSPNHKQELDSEAKIRTMGVSTEKVIPNGSDSSSRKLKLTKNGQALEIENIEGDFKGSLRRVVLEGETADPEKNVTMRVTLRRKAITQKTTNPELMNVVIEETAHKVCSKNKVKALVDAFESLITIQDLECPSPSTRSV